jgi:hypothetical protein
MVAQGGVAESSAIGKWSKAFGELHRRIGHRFCRSEARACYELGRKSHRNADSTVGPAPSRSTFPAFLSRF